MCAQVLCALCVPTRPVRKLPGLGTGCAIGKCAHLDVRWRSDPKDYGYPSFALGLAQEYFLSDPEIGTLVDRGDAAGTEQMLLDKALLMSAQTIKILIAGALSLHGLGHVGALGALVALDRGMVLVTQLSLHWPPQAMFGK